MPTVEQLKKEAKLHEELRNLSFKICETLNENYDVYERIRLLHELTLPNNLGFIRLYTFSKKLYSNKGFIVESYRNFLNFRLTYKAKPFNKKPRARGLTFFHVVYSTLGFMLKHHEKVNVEVKGNKNFKITITR